MNDSFSKKLSSLYKSNGIKDWNYKKKQNTIDSSKDISKAILDSTTSFDDLLQSKFEPSTSKTKFFDNLQKSNLDKSSNLQNKMSFNTSRGPSHSPTKNTNPIQTIRYNDYDNELIQLRAEG